MRKILIAVKSCQQDMNRGYHSVIRETWGKDVKAADPDLDLRFFVGSPNLNVGIQTNPDDETFLDCADDYANLPYKTREILNWSEEHYYDHTFLCDTDTFVIPAKLMKTGFERWDYSGKIDRPIGQTFQYDAVDREKKHTWLGLCYPWASGGFGYFVSRRAAQYVVEQEPNIWAEDLWLGQLLGPYSSDGSGRTGGFKVSHLPDLANVSTWHFPQGRYKSGYDLKFGWMEEMYKEHK